MASLAYRWLCSAEAISRFSALFRRFLVLSAHLGTDLEVGVRIDVIQGFLGIHRSDLDLTESAEEVLLPAIVHDTLASESLEP
jgi:hypothetical protein